jgi:hypothetical protein
MIGCRIGKKTKKNSTPDGVPSSGDSAACVRLHFVGRPS